MKSLIITDFKLDKKLDAKTNSEKIISFTKKLLNNNYINKNFQDKNKKSRLLNFLNSSNIIGNYDNEDDQNKNNDK